jgi:FixJ family two-component response regulator
MSRSATLAPAATGCGPAAPPVVVVIDDDEAMRAALVWLIESVRLDVRAYASADAFLAEAPPMCVGCIVTDMRMPGTSGLGLLERVRERHGATPVIVISAFAGVKDAVRAMRLGAIDLLEKPFDDQELLDRVQAAVAESRGGAEACCAAQSARERIARLTEREREAMDAMAEGARTKEIATRLGVSVKTADVHRANVFAKLEVDTLVDVHRLKVEAETIEARASCPRRRGLAPSV